VSIESDNPLLMASDDNQSVSDDLNERDYVEAVTRTFDKDLDTGELLFNANRGNVKHLTMASCSLLKPIKRSWNGKVPETDPQRLQKSLADSFDSNGSE
jgi:hypothetical protein